MHELIRSNDPVTLSYAQSLLEDAGIGVLLADTHMSILEGSLGIIPRRLLCESGRETEARRILSDAGLGGELRPAPSSDG